MDIATLAALNRARAARQAAVLVTDMDTGDQRFVGEDQIAHDPMSATLIAALRAGRSQMIEDAGRRLFLTVQMPPARMVIVGAVHISQALIPMARMIGYEPVIVDPRTAFATEERFGDVQLYAEWPEVVLPKIGLDRYTAFLALTHDPKIDDPGLTAALKAGCFYIGALGSRKTHAKRVERLTAAGLDATYLARIHAPIGLAIGAISPQEIAISILAEVISVWRRGEG